MITKIVAIFLCLPGSIMAVINAIRDDPSFTFMEKKESVKSTTPQQATGYLTLTAVAKYPRKRVYLARCSRE